MNIWNWYTHRLSSFWIRKKIFRFDSLAGIVILCERRKCVLAQIKYNIHTGGMRGQMKQAGQPTRAQQVL